MHYDLGDGECLAKEDEDEASAHMVVEGRHVKTRIGRTGLVHIRRASAQWCAAK